MKEGTQSANEFDFLITIINHEEPVCPNCGKGRIICPNGKIEKPHAFICTNDCGWYMNLDYSDLVIE